jgi:hypothetical protein
MLNFRHRRIIKELLQIYIFIRELLVSQKDFSTLSSQYFSADDYAVTAKILNGFIGNKRLGCQRKDEDSVNIKRTITAFDKTKKEEGLDMLRPK